MRSFEPQTKLFLNNLNDVFIQQHMVLADLLRVVLHRTSPDEGVLELTDNASVDFVAKLLNAAAMSEEDDRTLVVGNLALMTLPSALCRHG